MRRLNRPSKDEAPSEARVTAAPLSEGIIVPLDKRGRKNWEKLSDTEFVSYARAFMAENGISVRTQLKKAAPGLERDLEKREARDPSILEKLGIERTQRESRPWASMSDDEILDYARESIGRAGATTRRQLRELDIGLFNALDKRDRESPGLFRRLGDAFGRKEKKPAPEKPEGPKRRKGFAGMGDIELVGFARRYVRENGINSRTKLGEAKPGLYEALHKRGLFEQAGLPKCTTRPWAEKSDDEIVAFAQNLVSSEDIHGSKQLRARDSRLYNALWKRGILDRVAYGIVEADLRRKPDSELISRANRLIMEFGIGKRYGLLCRDRSLYEVLKERGLLGSFQFAPAHRWASLNDEELVSTAKEYVKKHGISSKVELQKKACGLDQALRKRGLLAKLEFPELRIPDAYYMEMPENELLSHAREAVLEHAISSRTELSAHNNTLYRALIQRKLILKVALERDMGMWFLKTDDELLAIAEKMIAERGYGFRTELMRAESGLYSNLKARGLLGRLRFKVNLRERRPWNGMSDDDMLSFAMGEMEAKGIRTKTALRKGDSGLYQALMNRNLLSKIFPDAGKQSQDSLRSELAKALDIYTMKDRLCDAMDVYTGGGKE
jgi:hypothetical protein